MAGNLIVVGRRTSTPSIAMPQHIGIVACSAEGAALCYRTICAEGAGIIGPHANPEVSMHTPALAAYVHCLERGDLRGVAELMLTSAGKLASIGADFLVCPDNTVHQAFPYVEPRSPRPWLHIAEVVAAEASRRGFRRPGLLGTRWLVDGDVYPEKLAPRGLECVRPTGADRDETSRIIMDELVYGMFKPESVAYCEKAIGRLKDAGCDAVILGCTELPLIIGDSNSPLPTLDSTRLLARAAVHRSVQAADTGNTSGPDQRPAVGVAHVVLHTDRMEASARFMRTIGMRSIHDGPDVSVYEMRGGTHLILMKKGMPAPGEASFDLMVDDLRATRERLASLGLSPSPIEPRPQVGHEVFTVREPAGHVITFFSSHASGRPI